MQMTQNDTSDALFPQFPPDVLVCAPSRLLAWLGRQRQRAALVSLDDRLLDDIGVTRSEAAAESRRWD